MHVPANSKDIVGRYENGTVGSDFSWSFWIYLAYQSSEEPAESTWKDRKEKIGRWLDHNPFITLKRINFVYIYMYILIPAEPGNSWTLPCGQRDSGQWLRVAIPEQTAIKRFHQQEKSLVAFLLLEPLTCDKKYCCFSSIHASLLSVILALWTVGS